MTKISIIMPVYNAERSLETSVTSVLASSFSDFELILIDDGSTDLSGEICEQIAAGDRRARVIHKENGGPACARNAGLDAAGTEWITWVDADDVVDSSYFEELISAAQSTNADIVMSDCLIDGKPFNFNIPNKTYETRASIWEDFLASKIQWSLWAKLYRAQLFDGLRFNESDYIAEDLDMNARIFLREDLRIATIPSTGYSYNVCAGSVDNSFEERHLVQFDVFERVVQMAQNAGIVTEVPACVFYAERCLNAAKKAYHAKALADKNIRAKVHNALQLHSKELFANKAADRGLKLRMRLALSGAFWLLDKV